MDNKLYVCPMCQNSASAEVWDSNTKKVGYFENIMSVSASKDDMIAQEPMFYCPNCGEEVEGLDVKVKEQ